MDGAVFDLLSIGATGDSKQFVLSHVEVFRGRIRGGGRVALGGDHTIEECAVKYDSR